MQEAGQETVELPDDRIMKGALRDYNITAKKLSKLFAFFLYW